MIYIFKLKNNTIKKWLLEGLGVLGNHEAKNSMKVPGGSAVDLVGSGMILFPFP